MTQSSEPQDEERKHNVVLDMADDRNIVEDIQFDIFEFIANQSRGTNIREGIDKNTPPAIVKYKMEDSFLMPKLHKVTMFGEISLKFSAKIVEPDFEMISSNLAKQTGKRRKLKDAIVSTHDG